MNLQRDHKQDHISVGDGPDHLRAFISVFWKEEGGKHLKVRGVFLHFCGCQWSSGGKEEMGYHEGNRGSPLAFLWQSPSSFFPDSHFSHLSDHVHNAFNMLLLPDNHLPPPQWLHLWPSQTSETSALLKLLGVVVVVMQVLDYYGAPAACLFPSCTSS